MILKTKTCSFSPKTYYTLVRILKFSLANVKKVAFNKNFIVQKSLVTKNEMIPLSLSPSFATILKLKPIDNLGNNKINLNHFYNFKEILFCYCIFQVILNNYELFENLFANASKIFAKTLTSNDSESKEKRNEVKRKNWRVHRVKNPEKVSAWRIFGGNGFVGPMGPPGSPGDDDPFFIIYLFILTFFCYRVVFFGTLHEIFAFLNFLKEIGQDIWKLIQFLFMMIKSFFKFFKDKLIKKEDFSDKIIKKENEETK